MKSRSGSHRSKRKNKRKRKSGRRAKTGPPRRRPRAHCVCTACGTRVPLYTDIPCYVMTCPKCGMSMTKEGAQKVLVDDESQPPGI